jgi:hypothetical protein
LIAIRREILKKHDETIEILKEVKKDTAVISSIKEDTSMMNSSLKSLEAIYKETIELSVTNMIN